MNEKLNLVKILKDYHKGTKLYSSVFGEVELDHIDTSCSNYPIIIRLKGVEGHESLTSEGKMFVDYDGECVLFPSRENRDWSKFKPKKNRFDPKTLNAFDKVLVRRGSEDYNVWFPDFVSDPPNATDNKTLCMCIMEDMGMVIPYNDETKHLVGTTEEAPKYYRYWKE